MTLADIENDNLDLYVANFHPTTIKDSPNTRIRMVNNLYALNWAGLKYPTIGMCSSMANRIFCLSTMAAAIFKD